jgi:hypothetical protein
VLSGRGMPRAVPSLPAELSDHSWRVIHDSATYGVMGPACHLPARSAQLSPACRSVRHLDPPGFCTHPRDCPGSGVGLQLHTCVSNNPTGIDSGGNRASDCLKSGVVRCRYGGSGP